MSDDAKKDDTTRLVYQGLTVVFGITGLVFVSLGVTDVQDTTDGGFTGVIKLVSGVVLLAVAGICWLRSRRKPGDRFRKNTFD